MHFGATVTVNTGQYSVSRVWRLAYRLARPTGVRGGNSTLESMGDPKGDFPVNTDLVNLQKPDVYTRTFYI